MKCPVCNHALYETKTGPMNVDFCRDGCRGIWFDAGELEKCDEHNEPFPEELISIKRTINVLIDRSKARACPRCKASTLKRQVLDADTNFEIDQCPQCSGHWVDVGELAKMRHSDKQDKEYQQRWREFEARASKQMQDPESARRYQAFFKLLF